MAKDDLSKRYRFAGDGLGVPGLPHEVSMQEAIELGVDELLKEAIKAGAYVESSSQHLRAVSTLRLRSTNTRSAQRE